MDKITCRLRLICFGHQARMCPVYMSHHQTKVDLIQMSTVSAERNCELQTKIHELCCSTDELPITSTHSWLSQSTEHCCKCEDPPADSLPEGCVHGWVMSLVSSYYKAAFFLVMVTSSQETVSTVYFSGSQMVDNQEGYMQWATCFSNYRLKPTCL